MARREHHYLREIVSMHRVQGDPEGPHGYGWECTCGASSGLAFDKADRAAMAHLAHATLADR